MNCINLEARDSLENCVRRKEGIFTRYFVLF